MKQYFILLAILAVCSCAGKQTRNLQKAQKKINQAIAISPKILERDTIIINDTVITKLRILDTITTIKNIYRNDTVRFIDTVQKIQVKLMKQKELLRVQANCKPDTIHFYKEIPIEKIIYRTDTAEIADLERKAKQARANARTWQILMILGIFIVLVLTLRL